MDRSNLAYGVLRKCAAEAGDKKESGGVIGQLKNTWSAAEKGFKNMRELRDIRERTLNRLAELNKAGDQDKILTFLNIPAVQQDLDRFYELAPTYEALGDMWNASAVLQRLPGENVPSWDSIKAQAKPLYDNKPFIVNARGAQALQRLNKNKDNQKWLMSRDGRHNLAYAYGALNDTEFMEWLKQYQPLQYKALDQSRGQISWAANNYGTLQDMYQFQSNPLSWLISALFDRDPSKLYGMINNINSIYTGGSEMNKYLMPQNKEMFQKYRSYLPWLNMAGNVRSWFEGDNKEFKTPSEQYLTGQ
jgi:hypothetical protein